MNKFEFACNLWGYKNIIDNKVSQEEINNLFEEWKFSMTDFKTWKKQKINIRTNVKGKR